MAGLLAKVAGTVLSHYGFVRAETRDDVPAPELSIPIFEQWSRHAGQTGLAPGKNFRELAAAYRSWIYSCVRAIQFRVATLPLSLLMVERAARGKVERSEVEDHPFLDMLWRPNKLTTRMELWLTTINHLDLTGNAFWLLLKDRLGIPREIWPLFPQYMRPIPHRTECLTGWVYTITNPPIQFALETAEYKLVHFKYPNPLNPYFGVGPVEAQAIAYDLDLYMQLYQRHFFQEGARPDFVLESDQQITKQDAAMVWAVWEERHKGIEKSWRPAILGKGLKARPLNVSNRDLAFATLADFSRDQILGAFGVPAAKLGLVADSNRANSEAADLTFNREAILPRCKLIEEVVEKDVLPLYPGQDRTAWLESDFENPVPEDRELRLRERETNLRTGVTVINEEREDDGKPPVPWGDTPILPSGMAPLGEREAPATPAEPDDEPEPEDAPDDEEPERGDQEDLDAVHTRVWEDFVSRTAAQEQRFVPALVTAFGAIETLLVDRLEAKALRAEQYFTGWSPKKVAAHLQRNPSLVDAMLFTMEEGAEILVPVVVEHVTNAVNAEGLKAIAEIGVGDWTLNDPLVLEWISTQGLTKSTLILESTQKALRLTLTEGVANGESVRELVTRIRAVFTEASTTRAQAIARTEVNTAANYGRLAAYKQSGVVQTKAWVTARDERVRGTHVAVDKVKIGLHEDFEVGAGHGPAPGQIGRPEEDINCRCTLFGRTPMDTPGKPKPKPKPAKAVGPTLDVEDSGRTR